MGNKKEFLLNTFNKASHEFFTTSGKAAGLLTVVFVGYKLFHNEISSVLNGIKETAITMSCQSDLSHAQKFRTSYQIRSSNGSVAETSGIPPIERSELNCELPGQKKLTIYVPKN